jgi:gliding motility-associated-like protein
MNKIIRFICFGLIVFFSLAVNLKVTAQQSGESDDGFEKMLSLWSSRVEMVRGEVGANKEDFAQFTRFYQHQMDSMHADFFNKVNGKTSFDEAKGIMENNKKTITLLYNKFIDIKKEFPSSVEEYRYERKPKIGGDSCVSACYNTGFEDGSLSGWYAYYATNSTGSNGGPFNMTGLTGGYCYGAPTEAGGPDPLENNDYQIRVTSGAAIDYFLNTYASLSFPQVSPWGGQHSVMLGDSTWPKEGCAILSQSFLVTNSTSNLTYQFAVFLERSKTHTYYEQPLFSVTILDQNGDTIPACGNYKQSAYTASDVGYNKTYYPTQPVTGGGNDTVYWKPWTIVNVPLKNYIGQCITIIFEDWDCSLGGHFGYAYVDAECSPLQVISSSPNLCGQDSLSLSAPPGDSAYVWSGPTRGIRGDSTQQTIWVDSAGVYRVIIYPVTGVSCADTLYDTVGKFAGPPPIPAFHATTACAGQAIHFINTSNDTLTANFYWDFYNLGIYTDTNVLDPSWVYASPGTYVVKLYEVNNGCGAFAFDTITVLPSPVGAFTNNNSGCAPVTVTFTNNSTGASAYYWNYGDPASNPNDTSTILVNGSHTYNNPGTYTITLIAGNGSLCPDTVTQVITVLGVPKPIILGSDSVCSGGVDTLTATGGTTYLWAPGGQTTPIITVSILGATTYTVTASNACGSHDTTITVNISSPPIALLSTDKDSICSGDTVVLTAGGGGSYQWNTGATTTVIKVVPLTTTSYTVHVFTTGTTCSDSAIVSIFVTPTITSIVSLGTDSICPGTSTVLTVTSSGGPPNYIWSTGATTSTITVNPFFTTTYYVLTAGKCANDSIGQVVNVVPTPTITISPGTDTVCMGGNITLTATGASRYIWSNGATSNPINININGDTSISVVGTNGNCSDSTRKWIKIYAPITSHSSNDTICSGGVTTIGVSVSGGNHAYTYSWNNGITSDSAGPLTVTPPPYQYICTITDGCGTINKDTVNIVQRPLPNIAFYPTPDTIPGGEFVNFVNLTTGASSYYWNLGDGSTTTDTTPFHQYNVAGTYTVILIAKNSFGCADTLVEDVYVTEQLIVPNVFTPNGDGINDVFHIEAGSMKTFDVQIFNRWGQKIFESTNPNNDWTGRSTSGVMESNGTYYYIIEATDYSGKQYNLDGFVELIQ